MAKTSEKNRKTTLLIVESPAKAKTIEHYLGRGYSVEASVGHLIDLPKSRIAIDPENNFEPEYITVRGKANILKELEKKAAKAAKNYLDFMAFSRSGLIDQLEFEGFTHEQAVYGVEQNGY